MTILKGTVMQGWGAAHRAIAIQREHLLPFFPDLTQFHIGTINVRVDEPLFISQFDVSTPPIKWHPTQDTDRFSFLRIGFQLDTPNFGPPVDAVIYHAAASPHHQAASPDHSDPRFVEVVTRRLNIAYGIRCLIHVNRPSERGPAVVLL
jgi:hypothetical protein